jgi:predicted LPLAT superfamily acyltransferase
MSLTEPATAPPNDPSPAGAAAPPTAAPAPSMWKAQTAERGSRFMLRFLLWIARHTPRGITRLTMLPTTAYFLLTAGPSRRASRAYLARMFGKPATLWQVARHFHTFATVVLDRMLLMLGGPAQIRLDENRAAPERQVTYTSARGSLLFVSHLGSFEALRVVGSDRAKMKFLLDRQHGQVLTSMLGGLKPDLDERIIDTTQPGPALALAVRQALDEGWRVGMMVDRAAPGEKTVAVPFLGAPAPLPVGPWALAAALQARIVLGFCLFRGGNTYEAHFEVFSEKLAIPRTDRAHAIEDCVRRYAARLEHFARRAPYNWFNFYDFWPGSPHSP